MNHRRNVFARKLKCPVCGADRPAGAQSERGQFFRRRPSVSPHDRRSRAYTGADGTGVAGSSFPPSPLVGFSGVSGPLQVESCGLMDGRDEMKHFKDDSGSYGFDVDPQVPLVGSVHLGGLDSSVALGDEVSDVWSAVDMQVDTHGLTLASGSNQEQGGGGEALCTSTRYFQGPSAGPGAVDDGTSDGVVCDGFSPTSEVPSVNIGVGDDVESDQSPTLQALLRFGDVADLDTDFHDLEEGIWKHRVEDEKHGSEGDCHLDPISQFEERPCVTEGWIRDLRLQIGQVKNAQAEDEVGVERTPCQDPWSVQHLPVEQCRSVSPTVGFCIDDDIYVPFTFEQCVLLIVNSHPTDEGEQVVAHPEFTPFWFSLGGLLVLEPSCRVSAAQGIDIVFAQGTWPEQCSWCLRPFSECEGCVFPSFAAVVGPSVSLPPELSLVGTALEDWKVQDELGMTRRQSFFLVVGHLVCQHCWKARVKGEEVLVIFAESWYEWLTPQPGFLLTVLDALLVGIWGNTKVFLIESEGKSFLARRWKNEGLRFLELFAGIGGWSAALPFVVQDAAVVAIDIDPVRASRLAAMRSCIAVPIDFLTADIAAQNVVIIGDIKDKRWLKVSLACPFRGILHSPPCTSFSGGGRALGLQVEDADN